MTEETQNTNKFELIFDSVIEEYKEKLLKSKKPKVLKINTEDKIHQTFKRLISKGCSKDFDKIYETYMDTISIFNNN